MLWAVDADPGAPELEGHAAMLVIIYWGEEGIDEIAPHLAAAGTRATDEPHKLRIPADSLDEIIAILTDLRLAFEPEIYEDEYIISPLSSDYVASADSRYSGNVECRMHIDPDAPAAAGKRAQPRGEEGRPGRGPRPGWAPRPPRRRGPRGWRTGPTAPAGSPRGPSPRRGGRGALCNARPRWALSGSLRVFGAV